LATALAAEVESKVRLSCIIETNDGLKQGRAIASADPRLLAIFFGQFDLSTMLGAKTAWAPLLCARYRVVRAAAAAGIQVIDSPYFDTDDVAGLRASAEQAKALGMTGKIAEHVSQVQAINACFSPSTV
jgi:(S)-citramalyl-CoA lyase